MGTEKGPATRRTNTAVGGLGSPNRRTVLLAAAIVVGSGLSVADSARAQRVSVQDIGVVRAALQRISTGDYDAGLAMRRSVSHPVARKAIEWFAFTRNGASARFRDIAAFADSNPDWPWPNQLEKNAELNIRADSDPSLVERWFKERTPRTLEGLDNAVAVLRRGGKRAVATDLIRRTWTGVKLDTKDWKALYARYKPDLRGEDLGERLFKVISWGRKNEARDLMRTVTIPAAYRRAGEARLLMRSRRTRHKTGLIQANLKGLPPAILRHEDMLYEQMRWHRRLGRDKQAIDLLALAPKRLNDPDRWWSERNVQIRRAIERRNFAFAYQLAAAHRQHGAKDYVQAEWFAGFISLRLLRNAKQAAPHFDRAARAVKYGWDSSRLAYWRARTAEALGDAKKAKQLYESAARLGTTFYGQLAAAKLEHKALNFAKGDRRSPSDAAFWSSDLVRATQIYLRAGQGYVARSFALTALISGTDTPRQSHYLAKFVLDLTGSQYKVRTGVRLAKIAQMNRHPLLLSGYPVLRLPVANEAEPALVYALIRQESEFQVSARSWVGARGLMQLMYFTARAEARDLKLPYSLGRLTSDQAYNLRLGTNHLARLLREFEGAYPLALGAYNAGSLRVQRWLAAHGDPRKKGGNVDWVDWIELVPFDETRGYIKRVLEALPIYRKHLKHETEPAELVSTWVAPEANAKRNCLLFMARKDGKSGRKIKEIATASVSSLTLPKALLRELKKTEPKPKKLSRAQRIAKSLALVKRKPDNFAGDPCSKESLLGD